MFWSPVLENAQFVTFSRWRPKTRQVAAMATMTHRSLSVSVKVPMDAQKHRAPVLVGWRPQVQGGGAFAFSKRRNFAPMVVAPGGIRRFCSSTATLKTKPTQGSHETSSIVEVDFEALKQMTPDVIAQLKQAFVGPKAFGVVAVVNIPDYGDKLTKAFRAGIDLALTDPKGRERSAAVSNTYPGWSGTPGSETHPLQSSFLFNTKEVIPNGKVDPFFGKNVFPSPEYENTWTELVTPMHEAALGVLRGCDVIVEESLVRKGMKWSETGRSLHRLGAEGPALASRFICYDSNFTREDKLLEEKDNQRLEATHEALDDSISPLLDAPLVKPAGHAGDGLASMRTHSTPIKSVGHAGDGLASMRTHSTPVKSAGHAGDGLASMRTHSTPVKSAGHAGDGLASMRTHSTPVKSAGHAGDGLASMRTHSTPVKSAGHAGDGLASMRTHSTPVKSAGHAGDGLASMRTHSTPVKSAGHAGDGLASMRTHSTPVKSAGHAGDGLASMRTHSTPVKSAGQVMPSIPLGAALKQSGQGMDKATAVRAQSTQSIATTNSGSPEWVLPLADIAAQPVVVTPRGECFQAAKDEAGDYWLPWHIDSNFITVLHREKYANELSAEFVPEPEGAGLLSMNVDGEVRRALARDDAVLVQMGAFGQIYTGGELEASRHAVLSPRPPGIARFNFCNFWYAPWDTMCDAPRGCEEQAVTTGWNAMMDSSYLDITMRQGFSAFRQFMTSPEARLQFADSVQFKELSELLPLPGRGSRQRKSPVAAVSAPSTTEVVVDILTDVRCPFSFISQLNLEAALRNLGLDDAAAIRFQPVFLNPNVPKEGESLDTYLLRDYGYSKEYAHSDTYPLRLMGLEAGVELNPDRRVVNTFDAFCLISAAEEVGLQREAVAALSRRYFVEAEDISDEQVLRAAAAEAGLPADQVSSWLQDDTRKSRVQAMYEDLSSRLGEVPHFLLRDGVSGKGVEVSGNRSVADWEQVLQTVLEKARHVGMSVPGLDGQSVWLAESNPTSPISLAVSAQHTWAPEVWPYSAEDFSRMDESSDELMYSQPRLVNHLDDESIARLKEVYHSFFGAAKPGFSVLDLCSSWVSHFPEEMLKGSRVVVHGLNAAELDANTQATERHVQDLNGNAKLPWDDGTFDFVTLALSLQYLNDPRAVFAEMHRVLRPGGVAIVTHSHRCFIEKAVALWANETYDGEGHTHHVCRYFQHGPEGGWAHLSSADVSPQAADPVWLVTAVKAGA